MVWETRGRAAAESRYTHPLIVGIIAIFWGIATATITAQTAHAQNYVFNNFVIEGNARIGDSAILNQAGVTRGTPISAGQLNDGLQRLQNSGLFESVTVEPRGSTLVISVVELPTINRISFEGNRRIKDDALTAVIGSAERRVFNPAQAERDAAAIAEAYANEGRLAARVTPKIIRRNDNRVDLIFEVFEGGVVEIERLSFVGNRVYSDRRLRGVLGTKQAGLFRMLVRSDTFVADRIEFDKQLLRDFYQSRGYIDFRVNSVNAELTEERDAYFLVFNVQEGQQFTFGEITVTSDMANVDADIYRSIVRTRPGVVYSPTLVEAEIARMERQAIADGVDFMRVEPRITRNDRDLTLDVEFAISRGPRIFVERIDIEGNTTTLDRVVRRQFPMAEGDPFNPREIRQAAERIRALDFFSNSEVEAREGSTPNQVVIDVNVEEQPTGSLSFGGSYSASDGFGVVVNFVERNFLGRGQTLGFDFSTAEDAQRYGINFVEPAFLGRDVAFGLRVSYAETDSGYTTFDGERFGIQPSLTFPVSENSRLRLSYFFEDAKMKERDPPENGAVIGNEIAVGKQSTSSIGYTYTFDSRATGLNPNAGVLLQFGQEFAGIGGDNTFIRSTAKVIGERKFFNEEITLRATLEGGALNWSDGTNRALDRFLVSPSIMRGFEPGGIGPRDLSVRDDDPLGGNYYVVARFEAEFPIGLPDEYGITGALFYDVGNYWNLDDVDTSGGVVVGENGSYRHVVGFSILWDSVVGPLRFNFSNAVRKEDFDRDQTFDLTLSTRF